MKHQLLKYNIIVLAIFFSLFSNALANDRLSSQWQTSLFSNARAHILQATEQKISLSIEINLTKKYKTYWQASGSTGLPPILQINGANISKESVEIKYPQPRKYTTEFAETWGYEDRVVLFASVNRKNIQTDSQLDLLFDYAVCDEICLPVTAEFSLHLDAGSLAKTINYLKFIPYLSQIPKDIKRADSQIISANKKDDILTLTLKTPIKGDIFITDKKGRFYQAYLTTKTQAKFKIFGNKDYAHYVINIQYSANEKNYKLTMPMN